MEYIRHTYIEANQRFQSAEIQLRRPSTADIATLKQTLYQTHTLSCDFTIGGLFLWAGFFNYRIGRLPDGTVVVGGVAEDDVTRPAFWIPLGSGISPSEYVDAIRRHCRRTGIIPMLTAVPEEQIDAYASLPGVRVTELTDFADYIYEAEALASFAGKRLNKKRNRLNLFMREHPDAGLTPIGASNLSAVRDFYASLQHKTDSSSARFDAAITSDLLFNFADFPFEGAVLGTETDGIVAFAIGEVVADTLHIHIEKMNHEVDGAGEAICHLFARLMVERYPQLRWINRQDDAGDPGLRKAKQSYHPARLLRKYNVYL